MTTSSCSSAKQRKQKFSRTQRICWTNCAPIGSISVRQLRRAPVHLSTTSKRTVSLYECHDARDFREAVSSRSRARDDCGNPGAGWGPTGILQARLEELLVQKIVVETARYGRVGAVEELERVQETRKAREASASATDGEAAPPSAILLWQPYGLPSSADSWVTCCRPIQSRLWCPRIQALRSSSSPAHSGRNGPQ